MNAKLGLILTLLLATIAATSPAQTTGKDTSGVPLGLSVGPMSDRGWRPHTPRPWPVPEPIREVQVSDLSSLRMPSSGLRVRLTGWARPGPDGPVVGGHVVILLGASTKLDPPSMRHRWRHFEGELTAEGWLLPRRAWNSWRLRARTVTFDQGHAGYHDTSLAEIEQDPRAWHGRRVRLTGEYRVGFEVSSLDNRIWVNATRMEDFPDWWNDQPAPHSNHHVGCRCKTCEHGGCMPVFPYRTAQVEVWGTLETAAGCYGHLGSYIAELNAERMVYLGPSGEDKLREPYGGRQH